MVVLCGWVKNFVVNSEMYCGCVQKFTLYPELFMVGHKFFAVVVDRTLTVIS